jgi:hypothetical protein
VRIRRTYSNLLRYGFSFAAIFFTATPLRAQQDFVYFRPAPGAAQATIDKGVARLVNSVIDATWRVDSGRLAAVSMRDLIASKTFAPGADAFVLIFTDGRVLRSSQMRFVREPSVRLINSESDTSQLAGRIAGKSIGGELADTGNTVHVIWRAILHDGANYIRQEITIEAQQQDAPIREVRLIDAALAGASVSGHTRGSPVAAGTFFLGFEHPLSLCSVSVGRAICALDRQLPLRATRQMTYSSVVGVAPEGQLRRAFLYYVERERAHPYRTFLHYNSWYDLGYFTPYTEADALDVIRAFGTELHEKRGVQLSSFLFDDGWDNTSALWKFGAGFPQGFTSLKRAAEKYGAEPGVWLSPWGGYGQPRQKRIDTAKAAGYETNNSGLALSGPKYFNLFRETTLDMVTRFGINQFKFDGTGNADRVVPGSEYDSDFDAAIHLIGELRTAKPDLYINLTTGTYPSPFWLRYADSIWRGGEDHSFAGVGSNRQKWITYRDAATYRYVVREGSLFPLNSLMLHGLIFAKHADKLDSDPGGDFASEICDYFGSGTQLQEMYISPALLKPADWDNLAEAAKWSAANAGVLVDTHWIGGDPAALEVYGWASWSPAKGILVLRNPSDQPQTIDIDVARAFELPKGAAERYSARIPFKDSASIPAITLAAGQPHRFNLAPFEVFIMEATPLAPPLAPKSPPKAPPKKH